MRRLGTLSSQDSVLPTDASRAIPALLCRAYGGQYLCPDGDDVNTVDGGDDVNAVDSGELSA